MREQHPLQHVFEAMDKAKNPLLVFDIDSTLMNTGTRNEDRGQKAGDRKQTTNDRG